MTETAAETILMREERFLREAIALAHGNIDAGGRPFGAVVVKDGAVIATGINETHSTNDPTSHAEMNALRAASRQLGSPSLAGCTVYASGQPCPMCLAAIRVAGVTEVAYAYSSEDWEAFGPSSVAIDKDLVRLFAGQSMKIRHRPVRLDAHPDLYADWKRRQGDET